MTVAAASFELADACDALKQQITSLRNGPSWTETPGESVTLDQQVADLRHAADNARTAGVSALLAEAATPLARLGEAVTKAKAAVALLKTINQAITIAGSLLSLAAAAATGDLAGIAKSAAAVISEIEISPEGRRLAQETDRLRQSVATPATCQTLRRSNMPEFSFTHPLFGEVRFRTNHDVWIRGDGITFISGFQVADIVPVTIPQLAGIPGANGGKLRFHQHAHAQLVMVFADIERLGLLQHIKTCGGTFNPRLRKPTDGTLSKLPSNHAFGTAIDLNPDDGSLGGSVAPIAPVFEALGFKWGKSFGDPMHFEVEEFIDSPDFCLRTSGSTSQMTLAGHE